MEFPFQLPLLLDGAAVSNLEALGMEPGECSELWALEHPGLLLSLQKEFLAAGAHALCAPTYGANRALLDTYGLAEKTKELNEGLIRLTKEAIKAAGKEEIPVGGRIGPSGLFPPPMGEEDFDSIYNLYREQIRALSKGGADFLMIEDQSSLADMRAAVLAARTTNLPVFVTLAVDSSGRTLTGCTLLSALITLQAMGIEAIGLSCSSPESMHDSFREAYPHACIPLIAQAGRGSPYISGRLWRRSAGIDPLGGGHCRRLLRNNPGAYSRHSAETPFLPHFFLAKSLGNSRRRYGLHGCRHRGGNLFPG